MPINTGVDEMCNCNRVTLESFNVILKTTLNSNLFFMIANPSMEGYMVTGYTAIKRPVYRLLRHLWV